MRNQVAACGVRSTDDDRKIAVAPARAAVGRVRGLIGVYSELSKSRLSALVVVTTAAGFVLGSGSRISWSLLGWTVIGTFFAAACANTLNQVLEIGRDLRMHRTKGRPLPTARVGAIHAVIMGYAAGVAGIAILAVFVNGLTAALGVANILIYLVLYTPLKTRTAGNTLVGAVCGAIPPMMGWTAVTGRFGVGGWILAGVLFAWQIPHFLALAWLYRRDYRRGGFRMLPQVDPTGRLLGPAAVLYSLALVPMALMTTVAGLTGFMYAVGAVLLGAWIVYLAGSWYRHMTDAGARRLFLASIVYLPMLLGLMVVDRRPTVMVLELVDTSAAAGALPLSNRGGAAGSPDPVAVLDRDRSPGA